MKKILVIGAAILVLLSLAGLRFLPSGETYCGFSKGDFTVVEEQDTHGGFHGDGSYYLILDCSDNIEAALQIVEGWNALPLSETLSLVMYGGERDSVGYSYNLAQEAHMPEVENGYYSFTDRHPEAEDDTDDGQLLSRSSFNFTLAVYDTDTNRLYYFEFDT